MMLITPKTEESLNRLLQLLFGGNAKIDNLYYNLQAKSLNNLANAIHIPVAHVLPEMADKVSEMMDSLGARPVRYGSPDHNKKYDQAKDIFLELKNYFEELRVSIIRAIEDADLNDDVEVKIWLENFLVADILKYRKQAAEWLEAANWLDEQSFNIHIADYTHYIK